MCNITLIILVLPDKVTTDYVGAHHKQAVLCDLCTTARCPVEDKHGFMQSGYLSNNPYTNYVRSREA
jgi:hypothetical protein